jgi:hypothetical protein
MAGCAVCEHVRETGTVALVGLPKLEGAGSSESVPVLVVCPLADWPRGRQWCPGARPTSAGRWKWFACYTRHKSQRHVGRPRVKEQVGGSA